MLRKILPFLLFLAAQVSGVSQDVLFVDEFNDEKLPGWRISNAEGGGEVAVRNGKLILGKNTDLKIETRKSDIWLDYTTTLKLRLLQMQEVSSFKIFVRHGLGRFNMWTNQQFYFSPHEGEVQVYTVRPREKPREKAKMPAEARHTFDVGKWYIIAIEISDSRFTLFIDGKQLLSFTDKGTLAGTVAISTGPFGKIKLELDSIRIAQENVKRFRAVDTALTLPTTWAAIKYLE